MERFYPIPTKNVHGKKAIISACQKKSPGKPSKTGRFLGGIRLKEPPSCSNCTSPFSKEESCFYPVLRSLSLFYLRCILAAGWISDFSGWFCGAIRFFLFRSHFFCFLLTMPRQWSRIVLQKRIAKEEI